MAKRMEKSSPALGHNGRRMGSSHWQRQGRTQVDGNCQVRLGSGCWAWGPEAPGGVPVGVGEMVLRGAAACGCVELEVLVVQVCVGVFTAPVWDG